MRVGARSTVAALAVVGATVALAVRPAFATATFTVNATTDEPDATVGDGKCATEGGACTLRAALGEAGKADATITLPAGTYRLSSSLPVSGSSRIDLAGAGAATTVIDNADGKQGLQVASRALSLQGLTVRGGQSVDGGSALSSTDSAITLRRVVVEENSGDGDGGALRVAGGSLTIESSEFRDNVGDNGGAIAVTDAALRILDTKLHDNRASGAAGALYLARVTALHIERTSFATNLALGHGGAIYVDGWSGGAPDVSIKDSQFKGNSSTGSGGALYIRGTDGVKLGVARSIFTENAAAAGGAIAVERGGVTIDSSKFVGNQASAGQGGAVAAGGAVTVLRSQFAANHATSTGGAISFLNPPAPRGSGGNTFSKNASDEGERDVAGATLASLTGRSTTNAVSDRHSGGTVSTAIAAFVLLIVVAAAAWRVRRRTS